MRRIASRRCAVDARHHFVAFADRARLHFALVNHQTGQRVLRIRDPHPRAGELDDTGIADLTTRLGVERRAIEHDRDRRAGFGLGEAVVAADHGPHLRALGLVLLAAGEVGGPELVEQLAVQRHRRVGLAAERLVRLFRLRLLLRHPRAKRVEVDAVRRALRRSHG